MSAKCQKRTCARPSEMSAKCRYPTSGLIRFWGPHLKVSASPQYTRPVQAIAVLRKKWKQPLAQRLEYFVSHTSSFSSNGKAALS